MGSACSCECIDFLGPEDFMGRKFSSATSRQQHLIIQQLRESQKKKVNANIRNKGKIQKIVPLSMPNSNSFPNDDKDKDWDNGNNGKRMLGGGKDRNDLKQKRLLEKAEQSLVEEHNLKSALTHPTILKFLKAFMIAQSTDSTLDFYLDVVEIRGLQRNRYTKIAYELWKKVAQKYILDNCPCPVTINPIYKDMIASRLQPGRRQSATESMLSIVKYKTLERKVLEGLELAQYEAFFAIKTDSWRPFCESDIFASLLLKKEVRTTLVLERPKNSDVSGGSFMSIMGSDTVGGGGGSVKSDRSGGSRRSSFANPAISGRAPIGIGSRTSSFDNSFHHPKESPSSQGTRRDVRHVLLSSVMRDMGTSAESAQQQQNVTPQSTPPEDRATSPLSSQSLISTNYRNDKGDRDGRNDRGGGDRGGGGGDRDDRSEGKDRNEKDARERNIGLDIRDGKDGRDGRELKSGSSSRKGRDTKNGSDSKDGNANHGNGNYGKDGNYGNGKDGNRGNGKDGNYGNGNGKDGNGRDIREGRESKKNIRFHGSSAETYQQSKDADYDSDGSYENTSEYKRALVLRMLSSRVISSPNVRMGLGSYSQERVMEISPNSRSCEG